MRSPQYRLVQTRSKGPSGHWECRDGLNTIYHLQGSHDEIRPYLKPHSSSAEGFSPLRFSVAARDLEQAVIDLSREYYMGLKLQGIAAKVSKLQHYAEFEAAKLDAKIEEVANRLPGIFSGAHESIDGLAKNVGDVETVLNQIQSLTNGPPAEPMDPAKPAEPAVLPVGPYPSYPSS